MRISRSVSPGVFTGGESFVIGVPPLSVVSAIPRGRGVISHCWGMDAARRLRRVVDGIGIKIPWQPALDTSVSLC